MSTHHRFTETAKARIDKFDAQIAEAEARLKGAEADTRLEIQKRLEEMRTARDDARAKLKELQSSSEAAWGDVREGVEDAWTRFEKAFDKAAARFG